MAETTVNLKSVEALDSFLQEQKETISNLISELSVQRTKVMMLEKQLERERQEREELPVPKYFINQVQLLKQQNAKLQEELNYFKKHVPVSVIINRENKEKPTRKGGIPK